MYDIFSYDSLRIKHYNNFNCPHSTSIQAVNGKSPSLNGHIKKLTINTSTVCFNNPLF